MDTDFELYSKEKDSECFYEIWIPVEKILCKERNKLEPN